ncbi:peptide deformylase [Geobacter sp. DSM 9736]|uniref:peptide deformylase n=1 Tax=Geobacter sp. DSM 9736 TaxID=1277350 RepID=UPI000B50C794|nr:peptide deformylase [Geobacter sp. DSM 9736]SNB46230.1 peptide deformylase [Geobacter sp. DSM 9736]
MPVSREIAQLGQPVLREVAGRVADPGDPVLQRLIDDMQVTMEQAQGVGIAAPQVFEPLSLFIVAPRPSPRYPNAPRTAPTAMINPEIIWASDEMEKDWEGCLSIPGLRAPVSRHIRIRVRYLTRAGDLVEEEFEGFAARVFQHEYDHVRGVVFVDRVQDSRELVTEKEYARLMEQG